MDFNFTRLPLFRWAHPPDPVKRFAWLSCRSASLVYLEFPAFAVICMLLLAIGALRFGLTGLTGWFGSDGGHSRGFHGGEKFLEHRHHIFHVLRVLFVQRI